MSNIDFNRLREVLDYNPETGIFIWKIKPCRNLKAGIKAGGASNGYAYIKISRRRYAAHRLAWAYVYNEWPALPIDHINGDSLDNRITNLRLATAAQNAQNVYQAQKNNSHGKLGLSYDKKKRLWRARIGLNGKRIFLGKFKSQDAAYEAYLVAKRELHPFSNL